jgi:hypothetical protein
MCYVDDREKCPEQVGEVFEGPQRHDFVSCGRVDDTLVGHPVDAVKDIAASHNAQHTRRPSYTQFIQINYVPYIHAAHPLHTIHSNQVSSGTKKWILNQLELCGYEKRD